MGHPDCVLGLSNVSFQNFTLNFEVSLHLEHLFDLDLGPDLEPDKI